MNKCCTCGGPLCKGTVSSWKVALLSIAMLFPLGIALYNCTKWLDIKAKIKKLRGNYREALEERSELLLLENILEEAKNTISEVGGTGDGPNSSEIWNRNILNPNVK